MRDLRSYCRHNFKLISFFFIPILISLNGCGPSLETPALVPEQPGETANYWCTWYWQNYLILKGQPVTNPDPATVYSNQAARDELTEVSIFGNEGMARVMLPTSRGDYYFLIDHGWQDKRIAEHTFFTFIMDTIDFPRYAHLKPEDRIRQMNIDIKELGWKGLGLWVRGNPPEEDIEKFVEWSRYAGIEYWKIDGGDTKQYYSANIKQRIYPKLKLEYVTGAGPLTPLWDVAGRTSYPSGYDPELDPQKSRKALEVIANADVFRTYDAAPLLVSTTTLQRVHDILSLAAGEDSYKAILNIQDDCNIAAALGLLVAVKRHPMSTPRLYNGKDYHLQISGDRHVDKRLNEIDRLAMWQRLAPPMPAGYGSYYSSEKYLIDSIMFEKNDTWLKAAHGKMVRQGAPAIMTRNIALPKVSGNGDEPYVLASKFPNGAVCIATEGRVKPDQGWYHPRADIALSELELNKPVGIFGYYNSLSLDFQDNLPNGTKIYAQDLLSPHAKDITVEVSIDGSIVQISGELIEEIGSTENDKNDISVPGLVLQVMVGKN
jgi:hypothetical protein